MTMMMMMTMTMVMTLAVTIEMAEMTEMVIVIMTGDSTDSYLNGDDDTDANKDDGDKTKNIEQSMHSVSSILG